MITSRHGGIVLSARPLSGEYVYVYVDGIYLKRSWGGEVRNDSILVAMGVNGSVYRELLGAAEGMKEDRESWRSFFVWLTGVNLFYPSLMARR